MVFEKRKKIRLKDYDYSQNGLYFLTVCTHNKTNLFGKNINGKILLSNAGEMVQEKIIEIRDYYPDILIDKFIVMPNHIHLIVVIENSRTPQGAFTTISIPEYMDRFKTLTTKLYIECVKQNIYKPFAGHVWQKFYYDHIIRDENDYLKIWEYIDSNPLKWTEDCYYLEN